MSEVRTNEKKINMEQECRCLFCGKTFSVREIVFAKNESTGAGCPVDEIFKKAVEEEYKLIEGDVAVEPPRRRFYTWDIDDVQSTEDGPGESLIPRTVMGHLTQEAIRVTRKKSILASIDDSETEEQSEESREITLLSSVRLCPRCHMTLPDGFMTEEVRRIGLLGGSRSGKTTYMVVACKYLENYFGLLSGGLNLGDVEFLQESNACLKKLYESQKKEITGSIATERERSGLKEKPVFPLIAHIVPARKDYKPFYMIIQDIPGEYMLPEYQDLLINSAIPQSTDLISLVDINSLTWTRMKEDDKPYGDYCELGPNELFRNFHVLGNELSKEKKLQTIQLCLTKLDFWLDANKAVGEGTVLARNGNEEHRESISDRRLEDISVQVNYRLGNIGGMDQRGLMDTMLRNLGLTDFNVHKAYTTVASRMVPGNENMFKGGGIDYSTSLNVLEPLLNIFSWANLLPHDSNERLPEHPGDDPEPPEPPHRASFWKRLFHRK